MNHSAIIIVADKGGVKAFRIEPSTVAGRAPFPRLIEFVELLESHGRFQDKVSDHAGAFTVAGGPGSAISERHGIELEERARVLTLAGEFILRTLESTQPAHWYFAAPAPIHASLLGKIPEKWQKTLREQVMSDLIKIKDSELLKHFSKVPGVH